MLTLFDLRALKRERKLGDFLAQKNIYLCNFCHSHYTPSYSDRRTILQCWYIPRLGRIRLCQGLCIHQYLHKM